MGFVILFLTVTSSIHVSNMNQKTMIIFVVLGCLIAQADAHNDNCRCGAANAVCRKHQWMILAMAGVLLTYFWMYGEALFARYCGSCMRWFSVKFGKKPEVELHQHSCGDCCDHHHDHEHEHSDCEESDCEHECHHCDCGHRHSEESENFFESTNKKDL